MQQTVDMNTFENIWFSRGENRPVSYAVDKFVMPIISAGDDDGPGRNGGGNGSDTGVIVETAPKTKKPSMYKVLLLNDDYTPMEFVIYILERFFNKATEEATKIMLHVHQRGVGICGVFPYEIAESKVTQVIDFARKHEHPLQCTLEKE
jgi:ATP-dependent Clp protease adaptor protein ClpS